MRTYIYSFIYIVAIAYSFIFIGCGSKDRSYKNDPLAQEQWYLDGGKNNYTNINLINVPHRGNGVLIAIVDNGIDIYHEDLKKNIGIGSYSYLTKEYSFIDANHGTACAGIIAGVEGNAKGIRGIASGAKIIGYNALKAPSISNIADAFIRNKEKVWISSNSWGDFNSWGEPLFFKKYRKTSINGWCKIWKKC